MVYIVVITQMNAALVQPGLGSEPSFVISVVKAALAMGANGGIVANEQLDY